MLRQASTNGFGVKPLACRWRSGGHRPELIAKPGRGARPSGCRRSSCRVLRSAARRGRDARHRPSDPQLRSGEATAWFATALPVLAGQRHLRPAPDEQGGGWRSIAGTGRRHRRRRCGRRARDRTDRQGGAGQDRLRFPRPDRIRRVVVRGSPENAGCMLAGRRLRTVPMTVLRPVGSAQEAVGRADPPPPHHRGPAPCGRTSGLRPRLANLRPQPDAGENGRRARGDKDIAHCRRSAARRGASTRPDRTPPMRCSRLIRAPATTLQSRCTTTRRWCP